MLNFIQQAELVTVLFLGAQNRNYLIHVEIAEISATAMHLAYQGPASGSSLRG